MIVSVYGLQLDELPVRVTRMYTVVDQLTKRGLPEKLSKKSHEVSPVELSEAPHVEADVHVPVKTSKLNTPAAGLMLIVGRPPVPLKVTT